MAEFPTSLSPQEYAHRTYAGVLGKIIGVYSGRPFEGWEHARLVERFGQVDRYVADDLGQPLIVSDDDISGTFVFPNALREHRYPAIATSEQIGQTWLNTIIEGRSILWWGGLGTSTEHTAYLRLQDGIAAPASGSMELNGQTVAEQIGAQIFIDGWAMLHPNDPERAIAQATEAARVSHDGEAVVGAQIVAGLVSTAYGKPTVQAALVTVLPLVNADSLIVRMIAALRDWHAAGLSWQMGFERIQQQYGYGQYGGGCHMVPNHAIIIHALLHSEENFRRGLMIANTCGWDTDCNAGNVGAILGVMLGLDAINADYDWRGPVADRMITPSALVSRVITDAAHETDRLLATAYRTRGLPWDAPKGSRYHFAYPGSVQGWHSAEGEVAWQEDGLRLPAGLSRVEVGVSSQLVKQPGYTISGSPSVYSGESLVALVSGQGSARLTVETFNPETDEPLTLAGPEQELAGETRLEWTTPDTHGQPILAIGVHSSQPVTLHQLDVRGAPLTALQSTGSGVAWRLGWVSAVSEWQQWSRKPDYRLIQNRGRGLLLSGHQEWTDLDLSATIRPHMCDAAGIAVRVQGLERYVALLWTRRHGFQLVRREYGDTVLHTWSVHRDLEQEFRLRLVAKGAHFAAYLDDELLGGLEDTTFAEGGIALVIEAGRADFGSVHVRGPL